MCSIPQSGRTSPPDILLIDDTPLDRELTALALLDVAPSGRLTLAGSGVEALQMLWAGLQPDLILLDINMSGMHGFEVLEALRADAGLTRLPVIMLTTSGAQQDREQARALQVHGYMVKAPGFEAYVQQMLDLVRWYYETAPFQTLA